MNKPIIFSQALREKLNKLNKFLGQEPDPSIVKEHKFLTRKLGDKDVPVKYIPVGLVEDKLREIFGVYLVTIKQVTEVMGSISVIITLRIPSFLNEPVNPGEEAIPLEWLEMDGAGAFPIFPGMYGVQSAIPGAKSFAIKDAAEEFGRIFGADLNRSDEVEQMLPAEPEVTPEIKLKLEEVSTTAELLKLYDDHPELHRNTEFNTLVRQKKNNL